MSSILKLTAKVVCKSTSEVVCSEGTMLCRADRFFSSLEDLPTSLRQGQGWLWPLEVQCVQCVRALGALSFRSTDSPTKDSEVCAGLGPWALGLGAGSTTVGLRGIALFSQCHFLCRPDLNPSKLQTRQYPSPVFCPPVIRMSIFPLQCQMMQSGIRQFQMLGSLQQPQILLSFSIF
jgi:hypothetical protein